MQTATATVPPETPTMSILAAVASELGVDVADLDQPLYDAIDPDALNRLLEHGSAVSVTFEYDGHRITVDGDGVEVADPAGGVPR